MYTGELASLAFMVAFLEFHNFQELSEVTTGVNQAEFVLEPLGNVNLQK